MEDDGCWEASADMHLSLDEVTFKENCDELIHEIRVSSVRFDPITD